MSDAPFDPSRSSRMLSMVVVNDRRELPRIVQRVDQFAKDSGLSEDDTARVNLVLDELVTNVIKYGYDEPGERQIHIAIAADNEVLTIAVEDDGKPFNPLEVPPPNLDLSIDARPIGGLGVHIVKSLADAAEYRRERGRNILTLTRRLIPSP